jgi:hypothetical protein
MNNPEVSVIANPSCHWEKNFSAGEDIKSAFHASPGCARV